LEWPQIVLPGYEDPGILGIHEVGDLEQAREDRHRDDLLSEHGAPSLRFAYRLAIQPFHTVDRAVAGLALYRQKPAVLKA
jgi:hypothetical protein